MSDLANTIGGIALAVVLIPLCTIGVIAGIEIGYDLRRALRRRG